MVDLLNEIACDILFYLSSLRFSALFMAEIILNLLSFKTLLQM